MNTNLKQTATKADRYLNQNRRNKITLIGEHKIKRKPQTKWKLLRIEKIISFNKTELTAIRLERCHPASVLRQLTESKDQK